MINVGDVVAYCHSGSHSSRRLNNMTVVKVTKAFIETNDGSRFSAKSFWQIQSSDGNKSDHRGYFIDPETLYWDQREDRQKTILQMNSLFNHLGVAAGSRDWEKTQEAFNNLKSFIEN